VRLVVTVVVTMDKDRLACGKNGGCLSLLSEEERTFLLTLLSTQPSRKGMVNIMLRHDEVELHFMPIEELRHLVFRNGKVLHDLIKSEKEAMLDIFAIMNLLRYTTNAVMTLDGNNLKLKMQGYLVSVTDRLLQQIPETLEALTILQNHNEDFFEHPPREASDEIIQFLKEIAGLVVTVNASDVINVMIINSLSAAPPPPPPRSPPLVTVASATMTPDSGRAEATSDGSATITDTQPGENMEGTTDPDYPLLSSAVIVEGVNTILVDGYNADNE
jgi:hypothetical protein